MDKQNSDQRPMFMSVFVKCILILTFTTAVVAGVISITSDRAIHRVATNALLQHSGDVMEHLAQGLAGTVRFGSPDNVAVALTELISNEKESVQGAVVASADGTILASAGTLTQDERTIPFLLRPRFVN